MSAVRVPQEVLQLAAATFCDEVSGIAAHGSGHIHDTFVVSCAGNAPRILLQRLNRAVFSDLDAVLHNVKLVTEQLRAHSGLAAAELERRVLRLVPTRQGTDYASLPDGSCWRALRFIEHARSFAAPTNAAMAEQAGLAFGQFAARLRTLDPRELRLPIPGFHDTPARLHALQQAVVDDPLGRAAGVHDELSQVAKHAPLVARFARATADGTLPLRVAHNDAKLDNLLFEQGSERALCVVDLDTVMPGSWLHDLGDLIRSIAFPIAEDSRDPAAVRLEPTYFEALLRGYLRELGAYLSPTEWTLLAHSGQLIALELGVRFLTDHVLGDRYFATARAGHNLERARIQLAIVAELESRQDELQACIAGLAAQPGTPS